MTPLEGCEVLKNGERYWLLPHNKRCILPGGMNVETGLKEISLFVNPPSVCPAQDCGIYAF